MTPEELNRIRYTITLSCTDAEEARERDAGLPLLDKGDEAAQPWPSNPVVLPHGSASVSELREFFIQTLVEKHNTTLEYAQRTALKWHLGKGWIFRSLPLKRFSEIFSDDIGPHLACAVSGALSRESKVQSDNIWADWMKTTGPRNFRNAGQIGLISCFLFYFFTRSVPQLSAVLVGSWLLLRSKQLQALSSSLQQGRNYGDGSTYQKLTFSLVVAFVTSPCFLAVCSVILGGAAFFRTTPEQQEALRRVTQTVMGEQVVKKFLNDVFSVLFFGNLPQEGNQPPAERPIHNTPLDANTLVNKATLMVSSIVHGCRPRCRSSSMISSESFRVCSSVRLLIDWPSGPPRNLRGYSPHTNQSNEPARYDRPTGPPRDLCGCCRGTKLHQRVTQHTAWPRALLAIHAGVVEVLSYTNESRNTLPANGPSSRSMRVSPSY
ncbi:hypothetical protein NLG97_g5629 [Lecanicillium saksenae]|uniref:Uncharacterized protein n=1 Tax=Lecanicillium saksenae TaxID=468837 RepID=A0ACC1QUA7_9HYPO|nr:hypothetical protein NLG97_g5629 [Lecanicillium saksenae]